MLGVNKHHPFFPFAQLDGVHALHLAAVGFATLMALGAGYRVLPMVIPAAMPRGGLAIASAIVIQVGTLGLAAALLWFRASVPFFALTILSGIGLFLSRVVFMLRNRRPPPAERPRPDWALAHAMQSLAYLVVTGILGLALALLPASDVTLRLTMAYGVCGLIGFLCQLVVGVEARLLPLAAWLQGFAARGHTQLPPSLHTAMPRVTGWAALALWTAGVPCLAMGLALDRAAWTSAGAALLAVGVLTTTASAVRAIALLGRGTAGPPQHG